MPSTIYPDPIAADGEVILASGSNVYALKQADGILVWSQKFPSQILGASIDKSVIVIDQSGDVYAASPVSGNVVWKTTLTEDALFPIVATASFFVQDGDGLLYGFNEQSGAQVFSSNLGDSGYGAIVANGVLYETGQALAYAYKIAGAPVQFLAKQLISPGEVVT